jgi:hypothetical protein
MEKERILDAVVISNDSYFLKPVSATFHGRDIFSPVAAALASGTALRDLGHHPADSDILRLDLPKAAVTEKGEIAGQIISFDHFGNLATNIEMALIEQQRADPANDKITVRFKGTSVNLKANYLGGRDNTPMAIGNSRGFLEIAVNCGNAQKFFEATIGEPVTVVF